MRQNWPWTVPLAAAMPGTATAQNVPARPKRMIAGWKTVAKAGNIKAE